MIRFGPIHLWLAIVCCLPVNGACAAQQDELEALRKRIAGLQQELEKTGGHKSEAVDALRESERAISDSSRRLAELSQQQRAASLALVQLQRQTRQLNGDVQAQQKVLGQMLYRLYVGGEEEYLKLLLNGRDPDRIAREARYYGYLSRERAARIQAMRSSLTLLQANTLQTRQKSEEIALLQAEQKRQQAGLEKDKRARRQVFAKIALQLKQQRREIGRLQRDENRLAQLVEKLAGVLARPGSGLFSNELLPDNRFDGDPFEQLKGKLALPVKGVVSNRFGSARPDSTVLWKGLFLRAAPNQPVKSVAAGRVVFADWLRGFGNLLIVDHGKGYMSLYGNNETLYKQVGDVLRGGDTVAAVGNTGGNEDSGLYFELRHEGKPFDPMRWVAAK